MKYIVELEDEEQEHVLTRSELVEYLHNTDRRVNQVERVQVDEKFIDSKIDDALRTAFSEILSQHELHSGDITPLMETRLEDTKDDLKGQVKQWIRTRADTY
jgi:hypothetical protein